MLSSQQGAYMRAKKFSPLPTYFKLLLNSVCLLLHATLNNVDFQQNNAKPRLIQSCLVSPVLKPKKFGEPNFEVLEDFI